MSLGFIISFIGGILIGYAVREQKLLFAILGIILIVVGTAV